MTQNKKGKTPQDHKERLRRLLYLLVSSMMLFFLAGVIALLAQRFALGSSAAEQPSASRDRIGSDFFTPRVLES